MSDIKLNVNARSDGGKGASRRLRRLEDRVPGIIYGGEAEPQPVSMLQKDLSKALENEAFFSSMLALDIDGKEEKVILRDLQRHPAKQLLLHIDFQRVSANTKVHVKVPLHFLNEENCKGVKAGGIVSHPLTELEVNAPAGKLPEFIEVDLADLEMDASLHISDLKLPEGVESADLSHGEDHNLVVASIHKPRGAVEADEEAGEAASEAAGEE